MDAFAKEATNSLSVLVLIGSSGENPLGALLLLSIIVEIVLSANWNKFYFTVGLPIFIQRTAANPKRFAPPTANELANKFPSSFSWPALDFKELDENKFGFREKFLDFRPFGFRSAPVMHGLLTYDYGQNQVTVTGYANWTVLLLMPAWFMLVLSIGSEFTTFALLNLVLLAIVFLALYSFQARKFLQVASVATTLWSERA